MKKINLTIAEPCHENWDQMTKNEKGRFCNACSKTVFDFTNMSDRELAEFFKKPPASICGRFQQTQLDRDILTERKRIPWIKYFFQFGLPALLLSSKAQAQGEVMVKDGLQCTIAPQGIKPVNPEELKPAKNESITGRIIDQEGHPIPFVTVEVKGKRQYCVSDETGVFAIKDKPGVVLIISAVGFETKETATVNTVCNITLNYSMMGKVVVVGMVKRSAKPTPIIEQFVDTAWHLLNIFTKWRVQSNIFQHGKPAEVLQEAQSSKSEIITSDI